MREELFELLTTCNTLQEFVNRTSSLVDTPFWVMDHNYTILAYSTTLETKKYLKSLWEGKTLLEHEKTWLECGLLEKMEATSHVVRHEELGIPLCLGDIYVKGKAVGRITFLQADHLSTKDAEEIIQAIGVYFREGGYSQNNTVLQQGFLSLLEGDTNVEEAVHMMREVGWKGKPEYRIAVLERKDKAKEVLIGQIRQIVAREANIPIVARNGMIIALESKGCSVAAATDNELFRIGYSLPFDQIQHLDSYLKEAVFALKIGKRKEEEFSTYLKEYLYELISKEVNPLTLIDKRIIKMIEYDKEYGTNYALTVRTYLENEQNKQLTADKLEVHLNTVKYRLQNVETLFGIYVKKDEEVLGTAILLSVL